MYDNCRCYQNIHLWIREDPAAVTPLDCINLRPPPPPPFQSLLKWCCQRSTSPPAVGTRWHVLMGLGRPSSGTWHSICTFFFKIVYNRKCDLKMFPKKLPQKVTSKSCLKMLPPNGTPKLYPKNSPKILPPPPPPRGKEAPPPPPRGGGGPPHPPPPPPGGGGGAARRAP